MLSKDFEVFFTIKKDNEIIYTSDTNEIKNFHWGLPQISLKQFFLPDHEEIVHYHGTNTTIPKIDTRPKILFGVHPYDIKAISLLDKIFLDHNKDYYYERRRKNFYIIGMGEHQFENFFEPDIFLHTNADTYEVHLHNKRSTFLLNYDSIFTRSIFEEEKTFYPIEPLFSDVKKLSYAVEKSHDSKIWDELSEIDLYCGICSYTCPLCHCFDLKHELSCSHDGQASKFRCLSSCYQDDFTKTSPNNKNASREKIYNWYHHKFVRMPREIGHVGCVDCGRCIKYCPAKINFKNVLKSII